MDKLKMHTLNKADENFKKLAALFPNAVTETIDENGVVVRAIDKDVLMQEISTTVVEGKDERYQFTWPDKKKSVLLANAPISKTLRPCQEESVGKDGTPGGFDSENLYIEGDNLEVLKLLQETYLGKIKMIYIDPPYNTGKDFVYEDDFAQSTEEYLANSGQFDEEGNRLVANTESNGRFHTNWLNMIYPRLKLARDLLSDDGVIFISIDDIEQANIKNIANEIFGESNFVAKFTRKGSGGRQDSKFFAVVHEYVICYAKNINNFISGKIVKDNEKYPFFDEEKQLKYKIQLLRKWGENSKRSDRPNLYYPIPAPDGSDFYPMLSDTEEGCWRWGKETMFSNIKKGLVEFKKKDGKYVAYEKIFEPTEDDVKTKLYTTILDDISNNTGASMLKELFGGKMFDYPKPTALIARILQLGNTASTDIILDFFSGSATTAHAVMQLNAEDGGNRKFIMVQLPEETNEKSEAYKAGYKNICEIGKERIRRAGAKIKEENPMGTMDLDVGFRVLKCDSSNMKKVYYTPNEYNPGMFEMLADNIKEDRTPQDLLFQVMLDMGVLLSSKIEQTEIAGKKVFNVADNFLIACFDDNVTEETITAIAKQHPYYFVMRDSSLASDSVATNFDQIFATHSPDTVRKVL